MYDANDDNQRNLFYCSGNPSFFLQIYVGKYRKGKIIVEILIAKNSSLQPYHGMHIIANDLKRFKSQSTLYCWPFGKYIHATS